MGGFQWLGRAERRGDDAQAHWRWRSAREGLVQYPDFVNDLLDAAVTQQQTRYVRNWPVAAVDVLSYSVCFSSYASSH
jgi:hypothetical protein